MYFYDKKAVEFAKNIKPSRREELEITSVNKEYLKRGKLKVKLLGRGFAWFDAGTHDSFIEAEEFVATIEKKTRLMIGCIEEIAYSNGWINKEQLLELAKPLSKNRLWKISNEFGGEKIVKEIKTDFLIIGAGIIGLCLAKNLTEIYPNKKIY